MRRTVMKKNRGMYLSLLLLVSISLCISENNVRAQESVSYAELVPESAVMVLSIPEVADLKAILEDAKFLKILEAAEFKDAILEALAEAGSKIYEETGVELRELYDAVTGDMTFVILDTDFKEKYEFALLLGMPDGKSYYDLVIGRAFERQREGFQPAKFYIDDVEVVQGDKNVFFAFHAGHAVMANSQKAMEEIVKGTITMAQSPSFKQHLDICKMTSGITLFADVAQILERTAPAAGAEITFREDITNFILEMYGVYDLRAVSMTIPLREGEPARLFLECPDCKGIFVEWFSSEPVGTEGAKLLPADTDSFLAFSINKPTVILDSLIKWMNQIIPGYDTSFRALEKAMQEAFNLSMRQDFLDPFGTKFYVGVRVDKDAHISDLSNIEDFLKIFEIRLLFQLENTEHLVDSIDSLIEAGALPVNIEEYNGVRIYGMTVPSANMQFWFSIHKSHLLICFSKQALTGTIDMIASGRTLDTNPDFQKAVGAIPAEACLIGYTGRELFDKQIDMIHASMKQMGSDLTDEHLDELQSAIMEYVGAGTESTIYAIPYENGLYIQINVSYRVLTATVPILVKYFLPTFAKSKAMSPMD
jgi:hypothetical protein